MITTVSIDELLQMNVAEEIQKSKDLLNEFVADGSIIGGGISKDTEIVKHIHNTGICCGVAPTLCSEKNSILYRALHDKYIELSNIEKKIDKETVNLRQVSTLTPVRIRDFSESKNSLDEVMYAYRLILGRFHLQHTRFATMEDLKAEMKPLKLQQERLRAEITEIKTLKQTLLSETETLMKEKQTFEAEKVHHLEEKEELKRQMEEVRLMRKELQQEKERLELEKMRRELEEAKELLRLEQKQLEEKQMETSLERARLVAQRLGLSKSD